MADRVCSHSTRAQSGNMKLFYLNTTDYVERNPESTKQSELQEGKGSGQEDENWAQSEVEMGLKTRLCVGERHFYASPAKLSRHSDYFKSIFTEFSEKKRKKVEIEVPFPENFNEFLYFLNTGPDDTKPVTNTNIIDFLCNADFLQASSLVSHFVKIIARHWRVIQTHCENFGNIPMHLMDQIMDQIECEKTEKVVFLFLWSKYQTGNEDELFQFLKLRLGTIQFDCFTDEDWFAAKQNPGMLARFGGLDFLITKLSSAKSMLWCPVCHGNFQLKTAGYDFFDPDLWNNSPHNPEQFCRWHANFRFKNVSYSYEPV